MGRVELSAAGHREADGRRGQQGRDEGREAVRPAVRHRHGARRRDPRSVARTQDRGAVRMAGEKFVSRGEVERLEKACGKAQSHNLRILGLGLGCFADWEMLRWSRLSTRSPPLHG